MRTHIRIGGKRINIAPGTAPGTKLDDAEFLRELERIANDPRKDPEPAPSSDIPIASGGFWWRGDGE